MDKAIVEQIITKLSPVINKNIAVLDNNFQILSKNNLFDNKSFKLDENKKTRMISVSKGPLELNVYIQDDPKNIKSYYNLVKELVRTLIYHTEVLNEILIDDKRKDGFIFDFLKKDSLSSDLALKESEFLGIDLKKPRVAVVIFIEEEFLKENELYDQSEIIIHRIKRGIERGLSSFYTRSNDNIVVYFGKNLFVFLKDLSGEDIIKKEHSFKSTLNIMFRIIKLEVSKNLTIGIGSYHEGVFGIKESFKEALSAAELGKKMWGENRIYHIDDFAFIAPFFNEKSHIKAKEGLFVNFFKDKELFDTLEIFLATNMSLTKSSKKLRVHRNTLVYRLDKIKKILGLDPRKFNEAVQIKLALILQKFLSYKEN